MTIIIHYDWVNLQLLFATELYQLTSESSNANTLVNYSKLQISLNRVEMKVTVLQGKFVAAVALFDGTPNLLTGGHWKLTPVATSHCPTLTTT